MTINREEWLSQAVELLRPKFKAHNYTIPPIVKVSCGWPSKGAFPRNGKVRLGECWQTVAAKDGIHQIFISPLLSETFKVLEILVHELIHSCLDDGVGHKKEFKQACTELGLEGPATHTLAGPELAAWLRTLCEDEPYPQVALNVAEVTKKTQTTRMLKISCPANEEHEEEVILRGSKKVIEKGLPTCYCGTPFAVVPEEEKEESED